MKVSAPRKLGPIGIWTAQLDHQPAAKAQEAVAELEAARLQCNLAA